MRLSVLLFDSVFLLMAGSGAAITIFGGRSLSLARRSREWPKVPGVVVSSAVKEEEGSEGSTYRAEISYAYEVGGIPRIGRRVRAGYWMYASGSGARRLTERYPAGAPVEVAHDPADPGSSMLEPGDASSAWVLVAVGVSAAAMGAFAATMGLLHPEQIH